MSGPIPGSFLSRIPHCVFVEHSMESFEKRERERERERARERERETDRQREREREREREELRGRRFLRSSDLQYPTGPFSYLESLFNLTRLLLF